jgi:hypothetical protein
MDLGGREVQALSRKRENAVSAGDKDHSQLWRGNIECRVGYLPAALLVVFLRLDEPFGKDALRVRNKGKRKRCGQENQQA